MSDTKKGHALIVLGEDSDSLRALINAQDAMGLEPVLAHSISDVLAIAKKDMPAIIVVMYEHLRISPTALFRAVKPFHSRFVMYGPPFGSVEHILSLEIGFDEVWPSKISALALQTLISTSLKSNGSNITGAEKIYALGDLQIDPTGDICLYHGTEVKLSSGVFSALSLLVRSSPTVVNREQLRAVTGAPVGELSDSSRTVDVLVSKIRKQLRDSGILDIQINHVRGRGYRAVLATSPSP